MDEKKPSANKRESWNWGSWPIEAGKGTDGFSSLMNPRISREKPEWDSELVDRREWVYLLSSVLSWKLAS